MRPALEKPVNAATDNLVFQQFDVDQYTGQPLPGMPGSTVGPVPIIRIYGVNEQGNSLTVHVHGFSPYFYVKAPQGFTRMDCGNFRTSLNNALAVQGNNACSVYVLAVDIEDKQSMMNYQFNKLEPFLRITLALPNLVAKAKKILEDGLGQWGSFYPTFETNVLYVLRFMVDCNLSGGNWLEIPKSKYKVRGEGGLPITSHAQIEVDVAYNSIVSYEPTGEWSKLAPLRIMSFDIECAGRKGFFPDATLDPVIQIASMVTCQGDKKPIIKNILTLKSCAPIAGAQVMSFETEKELLLAWKQLVQLSDPDIITGYNIINFDIPYLLDRAEALKVNGFPFLGRLRNMRTTMKTSTFQSKAFGKSESKDIAIDGRVQFDVLKAVQRDYKLRSYTLNAVSAHFLGEQKEDVHHSIITDLQMGNADTRRRLAVYCLKDAYLPQRLGDKLMLWVNYIEMARVTGVPIGWLLTRGQQIKVVSMLYRKCRKHNLVLPNLRKQFNEDGGYEGATVLDPIRGYYDQPVATLDFASLYPSIMQAHNLCYTTLLRKQDIQKCDPSTYTRTTKGDYFIKESTRKGILPEILDELLSARKKAKKDMKNVEFGSVEYAVLDGRQLALKISANSVYGFTGATVGSLPCLEIASSVTGFGRQMIDQTKKIVEEHYCKANGFEHDSLVVYGDTDSVMIKFGVDDVATSMKMGHEAAEMVTKTFLTPIKLEFEKVFFPYLLINKKRYAGLLWEEPDKYKKMDMKGIESVRRDNCPLVKTVMDTCLEKILIDRDVKGAAEFAKSLIADLLQGKMDLSMLVITKAVTKGSEEYAAKQGHIELMNRMRKRDAGSAPTMGDRVPYVMIKGAKGAKGWEKTEDPIWVLDHNIPIDTQYYLDHQLTLPLTRLFEPILDNPQSLFKGDHTRKIFIPTPTTGGIMAFAKKVATCMGCKAPLKDKNLKGSLCVHCKPKEVQLFWEAQQKVNDYQETYSRAWTQCQSCQGSVHTDVLCSSRDCPIFYLRKKVQKDLEDAQTKLEKFDLDW